MKRIDSYSYHFFFLPLLKKKFKIKKKDKKVQHLPNEFLSSLKKKAPGLLLKLVSDVLPSDFG